ncbi:MAG: hypothetical protein ACYC2O_01690 [Microthrixaceae bacterium]
MHTDTALDGQIRASGSTTYRILAVLAAIVGCGSAFLFSSTVTQELLSADAAFTTGTFVVRVAVGVVGFAFAMVLLRTARKHKPLSPNRATGGEDGRGDATGASAEAAR